MASRSSPASYSVIRNRALETSLSKEEKSEYRPEISRDVSLESLSIQESNSKQSQLSEEESYFCSIAYEKHQISDPASREESLPTLLRNSPNQTEEEKSNPIYQFGKAPNKANTYFDLVPDEESRTFHSHYDYSVSRRTPPPSLFESSETLEMSRSYPSRLNEPSEKITSKLEPTQEESESRKPYYEYSESDLSAVYPEDDTPDEPPTPSSIQIEWHNPCQIPTKLLFIDESGITTEETTLRPGHEPKVIKGMNHESIVIVSLDKENGLILSLKECEEHLIKVFVSSRDIWAKREPMNALSPHFSDRV